MKRLRDFTMARVGLGRAGDAVPLRELLDFRRAHAAARDAVHEALDIAWLRTECEIRGWECVAVRSAAAERTQYLRRPDLGRRLGQPMPELNREAEITIVVADGLSALAIHRHAVPLLELLLPRLDRVAPLVLVEQGRVAIGDEIGFAWKSKLTLVLIGERPGLTSPDSMGAYLTWEPRPGRVDAERNCISNIRPEGLGYAAAADRLCILVHKSFRLGLTGIALKEAGIASLPF